MTHDPEHIAAGLNRADRKAIMTRSGQGDYGNAAFVRLLSKRLVGFDFRWTLLGLAVRKILITQEARRG